MLRELQVKLIHDLDMVSCFLASFIWRFLLLFFFIVLSFPAVAGIMTWDVAVATGLIIRSVPAFAYASSFAFLSGFTFPFSLVVFVAARVSISVVIEAIAEL
jgi:hypothetical protein